MYKIFKGLVLIGFLFCSLASLAFAEDITITTYYPAPYGSYAQLKAQLLAVGPNYSDATKYCWTGTCTTHIDGRASLVVEALPIHPVNSSDPNFVDSRVGIGTIDPQAPLHILSYPATSDQYAGQLHIAQPDYPDRQIRFEGGQTLKIYSTNDLRIISAAGITLETIEPGPFIAQRMNISNTGAVVIGIDAKPGSLEVKGPTVIGSVAIPASLNVYGPISQRGTTIHADYVFDPDYKIESIEDHANYMWKNKHLSAIPKATKDKNGQEVVELGAMNRGIVEELEKAHIYIEKLNQYIKSQQQEIDNLKVEINKLQSKVK